MYEKILQKLKEQRGQNSQVSDKTLESMAKTWGNVIKDDETLGNIDFTEQISSLQGNIGHIAKQVKEDTEKIFKKPESAQPAPKPNEPKPEDMPEWAKALLDQNKQNAELLAKMQGEKITTDRIDEINTILKDAPKVYKDQVLLSRFDNMNDDDFLSFKETTKTNFEGFQQMAKEQGLSFATPTPNVNKPKDDGRTPELANAAKIIADAKKE